MAEQDRDTKSKSRAAPDRDAAGGMEGGMAAGSAGGPGQNDLERAEPDEAAQDDGPARPVGRESVAGDLGQGSFEQTQGGASPGSGRT